MKTPAKVNQVGSHIILQTQEPTPHRVAVPAHKAVRLGRLNGILRAAANHLTNSENPACSMRPENVEFGQTANVGRGPL